MVDQGGYKSARIHRKEEKGADERQDPLYFVWFFIFHVNHPLHLSETLVYYIGGRKKMQINTKIITKEHHI